MPKFRDMPIKQKLMVIIMSVAASSLLLTGLTITVSDAFLFRRNMLGDASALSRIVADNTTAALSFDDPAAATQTLLSLRARPHIVAACVYRPNGAIFASYVRPGAKLACPAGNLADEMRFVDDGLLSRTPISVAGKRVGTLAMVMDLGGLWERLRLYTQMVAVVILVVGVFAFLLSSRLRAVIAGPVANLAQTARSVSDSRDYSIRAQKLAGDELGSLAEDFNAMLVRIESQHAELRRALDAQEAALKETREIRDSLRTTLASIGDAVISTDTAGKVVFVNPVAQALLRLQESELIGRNLDDVFRIVNEYSRERVENPIAKVLREGRIVGMANHTILIAGDGAEIPIDDSGAPIRGDGGAIQGTVLVFRDVTPRRRADETSRMLASIVESTEDAIFSHDLQGIVTSWNRGAERIFGFSAVEMIGRPISEITPASLHHELDAVLVRIQRGERIEHHESQRCTKTGAMLTVSETVSPMQDPLGRIVGASTISHDITAQVAAAEHLARLNEDLRRTNVSLALTNQDLERFAFIASHDLQEPLRMITAYSQLLIRSYRGQFDADATTFVGNIVDGTRRMRELLADLLAYTEIRTRGGEETPEAIDLNVVMEEVLRNLKTAIDESHAAISCDRLPTLRAFRGHFQPLLQNLVGNAIKYRGALPPRIHISVEETAGELQFAVSDNGIGIAPEYHKQIFEVFRRLHGKDIPGTGVGLAICQRVVERYGGRIWVDSEEGKGAKFLFTLPNLAVQAAGGGTREA